MKFSKYNNPSKKKHYYNRTPKCQYVPSIAELNYCKSINVAPQEYVDIKYERIDEKKNIFI